MIVANFTITILNSYRDDGYLEKSQQRTRIILYGLYLSNIASIILARARAPPPLVNVFVVARRAVRVVEHRTQPAVKPRVPNYRARAFPSEVFVVQLMVAVQQVQIFGQLFW